MNHDEAFNEAERAALDSWRAPAPSPDFAARVLARAALGTVQDHRAANATNAGAASGADGAAAAAAAGMADAVKARQRTVGHAIAGPAASLSALAAAAVFVVLLGGLWSLRGAGTGSAKSGADPVPTPAVQRAVWGVPNDHDAGPRPEAAEVQPPDDGVQATAS